jgi:hypothetical protein
VFIVFVRGLGAVNFHVYRLSQNAVVLVAVEAFAQTIMLIWEEYGPDGNWSRASIGERLGCGFWQGRIIFPKHEHCSSSRWNPRRLSSAGLLSLDWPLVVKPTKASAKLYKSQPQDWAAMHCIDRSCWPALRAWSGHWSLKQPGLRLQVGTRNKWWAGLKDSTIHEELVDLYFRTTVQRNGPLWPGSESPSNQDPLAKVCSSFVELEDVPDVTSLWVSKAEEIPTEVVVAQHNYAWHEYDMSTTSDKARAINAVWEWDACIAKKVQLFWFLRLAHRLEDERLNFLIFYIPEELFPDIMLQEILPKDRGHGRHGHCRQLLLSLSTLHTAGA